MSKLLDQVELRSDAEIIARIINAAPKFYNIPLSSISQSDINASNALSKAQTELRDYWKSNLEGKIGIQHGKQSHGRNERAYTFSRGKNKSYQGIPVPLDQVKTNCGNNRGKQGTGDKMWKKFKGFCKYYGKQGHKAIHCNSKPQRTAGHSVNGTGIKNNQMRCSSVGNQDITVKTAQRRDRTIWGANRNCLLASLSTV
jgi:hypothetical protein